MPTPNCYILCLLSVFATATDELETWMFHMSKQRRCYPELGCFDLQSPWFSWDRPVPVLPQHPKTIGTKFFLLTRSNIDEPELLQTRPVIDLSGSKFRNNQPVFYIVHGYISHYTEPWIISTAAQLLKLFNGNVILVDWANGANTINYIQAVANTRLVGAEIARLSLALSERGLAKPQKTHGIGFSLGAQVLAYIANNITALHRITALDPAQPGFEGTEPIVRLDENDADFVDVIHTNGVPFLPDLGLGMYSSIGDVDFFVNGGETQPGCRRGNGKSGNALKKKDVYKLVHKYLSNYANLNIRVDSIGELEELIGLEIDDPLLEPGPPITSFGIYDFLSGTLSSLIEYVNCSHEKAPQYFLESLEDTNCTFWGVPWDLVEDAADVRSCSFQNCSAMGIRAILYPTRGSFYVPTEQTQPFCKWNPRIEILMKNNLVDELLMKNFDKCLR